MLWVTDGRAKTLMDRQVFQVSSLSVSFWPVFSLSTYRTIYLCIKLASFLPISLMYQASCVSIYLSILSYPFLSYPFRSYPFRSYPFLSYPFLSYPFLSYPILSYPILSHPILPYPILSNISVLGHISLQNRSKPLMTRKRASHHNSVHSFDFYPSRSGLRMECFVHFDMWNVLRATKRVPFFISHLATGLRTRRFSEPRERERVRVGRRYRRAKC